MVTAMLGMGMYYTPYSFSQSGTLLGVFLLACVMVITNVSIFSLLICAKKVTAIRNENVVDLGNVNKEEMEEIKLDETEEIKLEEMEKMKLEETVEVELEETKEEVNKKTMPVKEVTYANIISEIRKYGENFINYALILNGCATCILYQKFFAEKIAFLFGAIRGEGFWHMYYALGLIASSIPLLFASLKSNITDYGFLSNANVFIIVLIGLTIGLSSFIFPEFIISHVPNSDKGDIPFTISNFIFAMSCQVNVVLIFNNLKDKSTKNLALLAIIAPLINFLIYSLIGIGGARLLGENTTKQDIIETFSRVDSPIRIFIETNYPFLEWIPYLLSVLSIITLMVSFQFELAVVIKSIKTFNILKNSSERKGHILITLFCYVFMTLVNLIPKISLNILFVLIGDLILVPLGFIIPFVYLIYFYGKRGWWVKFGSCFIMMLGASFTIYDLYRNIFGLFAPNNSSNDIIFESTISSILSETITDTLNTTD
ncbi:hypothetical protein NGRA_2100 [Nosema granulosis]|uniref:Amino acid transporter transmembrane domain-containing protein n=1 Tax=Nosema granulosis TaxID=83296 RepID=A0A9P6GXC4_9MICR|nr:hypothetical protein NGRA_2100 [Nosema granulosis]